MKESALFGKEHFLFFIYPQGAGEQGVVSEFPI
jgi:hypothetical protein